MRCGKKRCKPLKRWPQKPMGSPSCQHSLMNSDTMWSSSGNELAQEGEKGDDSFEEDDSFVQEDAFFVAYPADFDQDVDGLDTEDRPLGGQSAKQDSGPK